MEFTSINDIREAIRTHPQNVQMCEKGYDPVFSASPTARIAIIGQAPGRIAQTTHKPWNDKSGENLRAWLQMSDDVFYDERTVALVPMDFYFPGHGLKYDLPPRKGFADIWHPALFSLMPHIQLTILVGQFSQAHYLNNREKTLTETVHNFSAYENAGFFPLPHPSPRNNIWQKKNPWFRSLVIPELQKVVACILDTQTRNLGE